jgi:ribonucleoside-diphosphate reductase beta chain
MTPNDIKKYVRFTADWRMKQLGMKPIYLIEEHPLPWLTPLLNGVEHANFFEARATEYSKAATKGNWNEVWDAFDSRKGAKAASEGGAANEVDDRQGGLLGVAAE